MTATMLRWGYAAALTALVVILNVAARGYDAVHPDSVILVIYLALASALMTVPDVRIDQGRLTLNGVIAGTSAILLNPLDATLATLAIVLTSPRRGPWPRIMNPLLFATGACIGSITTSALAGPHLPSLAVRSVTLIVITVANPLLAATAIGARELESPVAVLRRNLTPAFGVAFGYFALAGLLISYVLDGSLLGYVLASIVCLLALALTDSIAGRRIRRV